MRGGWALGCGRHRGGRRAGPECPVSLCSVLDDEGSNLRQQKLDRQVSGAGPGGRAVSTYQPAWRGRIVSLPGEVGPGWWGRGSHGREASLLLTSSARAPPQSPGLLPGRQQVPAVGALGIRAAVLLGRLPGLTCASFSWTLGLKGPEARRLGPERAVDPLATSRPEL